MKEWWSGAGLLLAQAIEKEVEVVGDGGVGTILWWVFADDESLSPVVGKCPERLL